MLSSSSFIDIPAYMYESHLNILTNDDSTRPLWKPGVGARQEYYHIEINEDGDTNEDGLDMDAILNMNKYKCHICNIEVPKTYMNEHQNSNKHKTCKEITNLALERAKLQMQLDIPPSRKVEVSETYFCDPCSTVIQNAKKDEHEKSKTHKIAVKHDEMLENLLKTYDNIDNVEVQSEIDELESLKIDIDAENAESDHDDYDDYGDQLKAEFLERAKSMRHEVFGAVKNLMQNIVETEYKSVIDDMNQIKNNVAHVKKQSEDLRENTNSAARRIDELEDRIRQNEQPDKVLTKTQIRLRAKLVQKHTSKETKKENIENTIVEKVEFNTKENATVRDIIPDDTLNNTINNIMAKYFDTNCTIDAINDKIRQNKVKRKKKDVKETKNIKGKELNAERKDSLTNENTELNKSKIEEKVPLNEITNTSENKKGAVKDINNATGSDKVNTSTKHKEPKSRKKYSKDQPEKNNNEEKFNKNQEIDGNKEKSQGPSVRLVNYLKDITRKSQSGPTHSVRALTNTIVEITALNGDKFKVPVNNFHSFHVKALNTFCKVCERPNVGSPQWHISDCDHVSKIMTPIKDQNGIRQVDDIWSHCVLCNDLTKNIEFHLQSLLHKNKVRHCLIILGQDQTGTKEERSQLKKKDELVIDAMIKHNLVVTTKGYFNCVLCDVIVNHDRMEVTQHVNSFEHLKKIQSIQELNTLLEIDEEKLYCIACDLNFVKPQLFPHCNGKKHRNKLVKYRAKQGLVEADGNEILLPSIGQNVTKESSTQIDDSELICFVCKIVVYCIEEHTDSFQHKKKYYSYLEANKLNEFESDTFFCIPCNTIITIDYLMSHCTSRKHKVALKDDNGETSEEKSSEDIKPKLSQTTQWAPITKTSKAMPIKVLYQFREMTDTKRLLCTVCDEEVIYSRKDAAYHISTLDHVVAFNLMMLWNKIKKRHDKYYCDICRTDMTYYNEISHILGKQHADNLANEPKGTVYEYDRTLVTHAYAMSHNVGDRVRPSPVISVRCKKVTQE